MDLPQLKILFSLCFLNKVAESRVERPEKE